MATKWCDDGGGGTDGGEGGEWADVEFAAAAAELILCTIRLRQSKLEPFVEIDDE